MKRIITTLLAASMMLMGTTAFAQASIGAGYLNETNKAVVSNSDINMGALNGFYAGIGYDINEGAGFGISTGIYYSYLTGKMSVPSLSFISGDLTEHAINIPVKPGLSLPFGNGLKAFVNAGPTFVCGLSSKIKPLGVDLLETDNYSHEYLSRFDIMVGGALGVDINDMVRVSAGYDLGMLDQFGAGVKGKNNDGSTKDSAFSLRRNRITVGLSFLF